MMTRRKTQNPSQWADIILQQQGMIRLGQPKLIRDMPWSKVEQLKTEQGPVYLKQMAPLFAIEGRLLMYLSAHVTSPVPQVLAIDEDMGCFLMLDAGRPLRELFQNQYQTSLACEALACYASIQQQCIPHIDDLLLLGVPDWRLRHLPSLFENLIAQDSQLIADGLTKKELQQLRLLQPAFLDLCMQLADFNIPETIEHGDFHDNNVLILNQHITINDWGDTTITHPFFSCVAWLESAKRNHEFDEQHENFQRPLTTYLSAWHAVGDIPKLLKAYQLARKIRPIVFSLSFSRINACLGIENYPEYRGYIADALRIFITLLG